MLQDKKVEKLVKLMELANEDYATSSQVIQAIQGLASVIQQVKSTLETSVQSAENRQNSKVSGLILDINRVDTTLRELLSENTTKTLDTLRAELKSGLENVQRLIPALPEPFDPTELQNQINVLMAWEPDKLTAETVRDLLETLRDEERLDASAIKNLPERTETIVRGMNKVMALYNLLDVDIAGITSGQSIQWDGNKWVAYTPAGSGGTPVWGEDLTTQGAGTAFTLTHTPIAGTVRLFRGGAYQSVANGDYSISGANITLTIALQTGEVLVADYSYS